MHCAAESTLQEYEVRGYEKYIDIMTKLKSSVDSILGFFCGTLNDSKDESWCPDCTAVLRIIRISVDTLRCKLKDKSENVAFVFINIDRNDWKGDSRFRSDETLKLESIPTIILWDKGVEKERLGEKDCLIMEKVWSVFHI